MVNCKSMIVFVDYIDTNEDYTLYSQHCSQRIERRTCEVVANNIIGVPDTLYSLRAGDIKMPVE